LFSGQRFNFLIIIADDQRADSVGPYMPKTQARVFDQGVQFSKAYITTPECCPSRASMFTGQYASSNGVRENSYPLLNPTIFNELSNAGYLTGMLGKYLNTWNGSPRPEFDLWAVFPFGAGYFDNPILSRVGRVTRERGYQLDILSRDAFSFLERAAREQRQFALIYSSFAPHEPAIAHPRDRSLYRDLPPFRPPNFGVTAGKPAWVQRAGRMTTEKAKFVDVMRRRQLQTIWSLDRAVDGLVTKLEQLGLDQTTVIIYLSDNGLLWGEFGLESKSCAYEPSIRVPMAVRLPRGLVAPRVESKLVANIDLAPTLRDLAQLGSDPKSDGASLAGLMIDTDAPWREHLMIEGFRNTETRSPFRAVHRGDAIFIENGGDIDELYDLNSDPYQLRNVAADQGYSDLSKDMRARLKELDNQVPIRAVVSPLEHQRAQRQVSSWKIALRRCRISKRPTACNFNRVWNRLYPR
jgi:arylsulfatase A-like enzyme